HPNVIEMLDVIATDAVLALVMPYVAGASLADVLEALSKGGPRVPVPVAVAIVSDVLNGLHAAHEAKDTQGELLCLVHRDVSPGNVLVGRDGLARVLDFGVAQALGRVQVTRDGALKGKLAYMGPERMRGAPASRQSDLFGVGVVLWELLAGRRLRVGDDAKV